MAPGMSGEIVLPHLPLLRFYTLSPTPYKLSVCHSGKSRKQSSCTDFLLSMAKKQLTYSTEQVSESNKSVFSPSKRLDSQDARMSWKGFLYASPPASDLFIPLACEDFVRRCEDLEAKPPKQRKVQEESDLAVGMFFLVPGSLEY